MLHGIRAHKRMSKNRKKGELQRLRCRAFQCLGDEKKIQNETGTGKKALSVSSLPELELQKPSAKGAEVVVVCASNLNTTELDN